MFLLLPPLNDPCQPTENSLRLEGFVFDPVFQSVMWMKVSVAQSWEKQVIWKVKIVFKNSELL